VSAAIFSRGLWKAARFAGRCSSPDCDVALSRGDRVLFIPRTRRTLCHLCGIRHQDCRPR